MPKKRTKEQKEARREKNRKQQASKSVAEIFNERLKRNIKNQQISPEQRQEKVLQQKIRRDRKSKEEKMRICADRRAKYAKKREGIIDVVTSSQGAEEIKKIGDKVYQSLIEDSKNETTTECIEVTSLTKRSSLPLDLSSKNKEFKKKYEPEVEDISDTEYEAL